MPTNAEIATFEDFGLNDVQRISYRPIRAIEMVEPNPKWPSSFTLIAQRIQAALGDRALAIEHIGSTSVPDLPAKDVIDVNLVVADVTAEGDYVQDLEDAGFQFLTRNKEHRFFGLDEPYANIHVWGPDSSEVIRHRIFKEWLLDHEDDRLAYAEAKRQAASAARQAGETANEYNGRKQPIIREILKRAFAAHGISGS
ncbi:hypothetical protein V490_08505 [Pseudogymnoascus sp. VKM F-3557]|nr:hypothetical protein V490_08505 [Pseudogymnoascus sp. VKM F-3557]